MGKETVYCSVCGERIPSSDLEKRKASFSHSRYFCSKCASIHSGEPDKGRGEGPNLAPKPQKVRTQRIPMADNPRSTSNRIPFLIAAAVGIIALLLLMFVIFLKKDGRP